MSASCQTPPVAPRLPKLSVFIFLVLLLGTACDRFPRDPRNSLQDIANSGVMHAGATENPPWVVRRAFGGPDGVEVQLLEQFAAELGVELVWHWAGMKELCTALTQFELDLAVGGFTKNHPCKSEIALTVPYHTSYDAVGVPTDQPPMLELDGLTVAARRTSGLSEPLEDRGARVTLVNSLPRGEIAVAATDWELNVMNFTLTGIQLKKHEHVFAVAPGENALIMRLESSLRRQTHHGEIRKFLLQGVLR
ncbi:MAG: transporter substrate-binding domain-containing protein [Pseudohongiellaceae bacterium]